MLLRVTLAGLEEVVAPLGTGLTDEQAALLQRHTAHVICSTTRTIPASGPHSAPAMCCCATSCASASPRCRRRGPRYVGQNKGAAALEQAIKDSVDVLERKIQILDRKGFFGTLPGRSGLGQVVPTIRAAADPITRICTSRELLR